MEIKLRGSSSWVSGGRVDVHRKTPFNVSSLSFSTNSIHMSLSSAMSLHRSFIRDCILNLAEHLSQFDSNAYKLLAARCLIHIILLDQQDDTLNGTFHW